MENYVLIIRTKADDYHHAKDIAQNLANITGCKVELLTPIGHSPRQAEGIVLPQTEQEAVA